MKYVNIIKAVAIPLFAMTLGAQNPALAITDSQGSYNDIASVSTNKQIAKQANLARRFANKGTYFWGPQRDFQIWMPGTIEYNSRNVLMSLSPTQTAYAIIHRDFPEASRTPMPQIRQMLQKVMQETFGRNGKVVRTNNLVIDGHPGIEIMMQHSDGTLGQYQAFVIKRRLYFLGALTPNQLTTETTNFFSSFLVYPNRVSY